MSRVEYTCELATSFPLHPLPSRLCGVTVRLRCLNLPAAFRLEGGRMRLVANTEGGGCLRVERSSGWPEYGSVRLSALRAAARRAPRAHLFPARPAFRFAQRAALIFLSPSFLGAVWHAGIDEKSGDMRICGTHIPHIPPAALASQADSELAFPPGLPLKVPPPPCLCLWALLCPDRGRHR